MYFTSNDLILLWEHTLLWNVPVVFQGTPTSQNKNDTHKKGFVADKRMWTSMRVRFISEGAEGKAWDTQEEEDDWQTDTVAHRLCLTEGGLSPFPTALLLTGARVQFRGRERKDQESDRLDKADQTFRLEDQTRRRMSKHRREDQKKKDMGTRKMKKEQK